MKRYHVHIPELMTAIILALAVYVSAAAVENDSMSAISIRENADICTCVIRGGKGKTCYEFVDEHEKTCRERACQESYVCTNEDQATHFCLQQALEVVRLLPVHVDAGKCYSKHEYLKFRVPYSPFDKSGKPHIDREATFHEDLESLEPGACYI